MNDKQIFYHATDAKPFGRFRSREIWCDTVPRDYGNNFATIEYTIDIDKVFCTRRDASDYPEFGLTDEQGSYNRDLYIMLGGEVSRKPFKWARRNGYTTIFDEEGWCLLHPKKANITNWELN